MVRPRAAVAPRGRTAPRRLGCERWWAAARCRPGPRTSRGVERGEERLEGEDHADDHGDDDEDEDQRGRVEAAGAGRFGTSAPMTSRSRTPSRGSSAGGGGWWRRADATRSPGATVAPDERPAHGSAGERVPPARATGCVMIGCPVGASGRGRGRRTDRGRPRRARRRRGAGPVGARGVLLRERGPHGLPLHDHGCGVLVVVLGGTGIPPRARRPRSAGTARSPGRQAGSRRAGRADLAPRLQLAHELTRAVRPVVVRSERHDAESVEVVGHAGDQVGGWHGGAVDDGRGRQRLAAGGLRRVRVGRPAARSGRRRGAGRGRRRRRAWSSGRRRRRHRAGPRRGRDRRAGRGRRDSRAGRTGAARGGARRGDGRPPARTAASPTTARAWSAVSGPCATSSASDCPTSCSETT